MHVGRGIVAAVCAAATLAAWAALAGADPRIEFGGGFTAASSDGPQSTGASVQASMLWNLGVIDFGPQFFLDDLGSTTGQLHDPNSGEDLGSTTEAHRLSSGGAWRVDWTMGRWHQWSSNLIGTWGLYHVRDDKFGAATDAFVATGLAGGIGMLHPVSSRFSAGAQVLYHELFDTRQDRYLTANVILAWNVGPGDSPPARKATP